jgi:hypothetical protein
MFAALLVLAFAGLVAAKEMSEPGMLNRVWAVPRGQTTLIIIAVGVLLNAVVYLVLCPLLNHRVPPWDQRRGLRWMLNVMMFWWPFVVFYLPAVILLLRVVPAIGRL